METVITIWKRTATHYHMDINILTVFIWGLKHRITSFHMGILIDNLHMVTPNRYHMDINVLTVSIWGPKLRIIRYHMGI